MGNTGRETVIAVKNGAAWGTAVDVNVANAGLLPASVDPIVLDGEIVFDETIGNFGEIEEADIIAHLANPTIVLPVRRTGALWMFWAALFGDDTNTGSAPDFIHTYNWQKESALFLSMAAGIGSGPDIIEWASLKVTGIVMEPDGDGFLQWTISTIGDTIYIAGDATTAAFGNVTYITQVMKIPSREVAFKLDTVGSDPASASITKPNNYSLAITRPFNPELVARGVSSGAELTTDEPVQDGYSEIIFGFDVPSYTTIALLDDFKDQIEYAADFNFAKTISGTAYLFSNEFSEMHPIPAAAALTLGQRIPLTRNFRLKGTAGATPQTGMSTVNPIHSISQDNSDLSYETLS